MKRHPDLRDLSDDHHDALVLARRCRRAGAAAPGPAALWRQVRDAFADRLERHFRIEEDHLLPALEGIGEGGLAERIREDHAALRGLAERAEPSAGALEAFGSLLESHVRFEEREVFNPAQDRLPAASLRAIADACRAAPRSGAPSPGSGA